MTHRSYGCGNHATPTKEAHDMKINTNNETDTITFTFEEGVASVEFNATKAHFDLRRHAMMFGFENRIKDCAAIPRKGKDGSVINVTEAMRREAVIGMVAHLESGTDQWNVKSGPRKAPQNTAILALAKALGKTYEEAEAHIAAMAIAELSVE